MSRGTIMLEEYGRGVSKGQHKSLDAESRGRRRSQEEGPKLAKFCKDALFRVQVELGLHELTATLSSLIRRVDALEASATAEEGNGGEDKMSKVLARSARCVSQALPGITSARSRRSVLHGYFRESDEWRDRSVHRVDPATRALLVEGLACLAGENKVKGESKSSSCGWRHSKRVDVSPSSRGWRRKVERNGDGHHQPSSQPALKQKHIFCNRQHSSNEMRGNVLPPRLEIEYLGLAPTSSQSVLLTPGISPEGLRSKLAAREYFGEEKIVKGRREKGALKSGMRHEAVSSKHPNNKKSSQEESSLSLPLSTTLPPDERHARERGSNTLHTEEGVNIQTAAVPEAPGSSGVVMGEFSRTTELCFAPKDTSTGVPGSFPEGSRSGNLEGSGSNAIEQSAASNLDISMRLRLMDAAPPAAAYKLQQVGFQHIQDFKEWPAGELHDTCGIRVDRTSGELWREMEAVHSLSPVPPPSRNPSVSSSSGSFDSHHQSEDETCADAQVPTRRVVFGPPSTGAEARESRKSIHYDQRTVDFAGMGNVKGIGLCRAGDDDEGGEIGNEALIRAEGKTLTAEGAAEAKERLSARGMNEAEEPPKVALDAELMKAWRRSSRENGAPAVDVLGFADLGASSFGWADTPCDVLGRTEDQTSKVEPEVGKSDGPSSKNLERDLRHATCLSRQPASLDPQKGSQTISARPFVYSAAAPRTLELAGDECPSSPPRPCDHEGATPLISHLMALPLEEPLRREFVKSLARHLDDYGHRDLAIVISSTCGDASSGGNGHEAQSTIAGTTDISTKAGAQESTSGGCNYGMDIEVSLLLSREGSK